MKIFFDSKNRLLLFLACLCGLAGLFISVYFLFFPPRVYDRRVENDILRVGSLSQKVLIGRYKMDVDLYANPYTTVKYIIPVDENNQPLPSASNVVFYAPFAGDTAEMFEYHAWLVPFIVECGYSVFSMSMKRNVLNTDPECFFVYQESGWHDVVAEVKERLISEYSLKDQPLIAVGQSAGGMLIQRLLVSHPGLINIAAWGGSGNYANWETPPDAAMLLLSTWGDGGTTDTDALFKKLRTIKGNALRTYTPLLHPKDYHSLGRLSHQLIKFFVRDMVNSRAENNGISTEVANGFPGLSNDFYQIWNTLPHDLFGENANDYSHLKVRLPVPENPKQIIWIMANNTEHDVEFGVVFEIASRILPKDSIVIINRFGVEQLANTKMVDDVLDRILAEEEWRDLPLYIAGDRSGGQAVAVAALKKQDPRIRHIITLDGNYNDADKPLAITPLIDNNRIPFTMCFSQYNLQYVPESEREIEVVYLDDESSFKGVWEAFLNRIVTDKK